MSQEWQRDKDWADDLDPYVRALVSRLAGHIITFGPASARADKMFATDYVAKVSDGTIACRLRRPDCKQRDFTIRSWRASGVETELSKLRAGYARWYLYGWTKRT